MTRKPQPPLENDVREGCMKWLNQQPHIWARRRNVGAVQIKGRWVRFSQKGASDIEGLVTVEVLRLCSDGGGHRIDVGVALEVETKRVGNKPTDEQAAWLAAHAAAGAIALWCDSVGMLEAKLKEWFRTRGLEWPT